MHNVQCLTGASLYQRTQHTCDVQADSSVQLLALSHASCSTDSYQALHMMTIADQSVPWFTRKRQSHLSTFCSGSKYISCNI